jgi:dolichol-phosphate mannosyltransferase
MSIKYSVIIPLKDEEGNIRQLIEEIEPIMNSQDKTWEIICIDDGSTDQTLPILKNLSKTRKNLRTIVFSKNFGQSSAFDAGFKAAKGELIITLDGDRQNDPTDIPKLIQMSDNYDLICGIRQKRKDTPIKKITSYVANKIRSKVCKDGIADTGCSLKLYRRECLKTIKLYQGMHRFLPALFQIEGYRVGQVPVKHRERVSGKTKYNFLNRSFNTVADMFAVSWMRKRKLQYQIEREIG